MEFNIKNKDTLVDESIFLNMYKNDIIGMKIGDMMFDEIINNFYFERLLYIVIVVLVAHSIINNMKVKEKINISKYLNFKNINLKILLKYLFLSFIVRIILEQLVSYMPLNTDNIKVPSNIFEIIIEFIASCVFAPIVEEIIFRFGLYQKLNKKFNIIISMIITSIIFAIIHLYNIAGCIILIGISLVWNYLFHKTNNLTYPILLHFFHNIYALSNNLINYGSYWYILLLISISGYIILAFKKQKN